MNLDTVTEISIDGKAVQVLALDGKVIWNRKASSGEEYSVKEDE